MTIINGPSGAYTYGLLKISLMYGKKYVRNVFITIVEWPQIRNSSEATFSGVRSKLLQVKEGTVIRVKMDCDATKVCFYYGDVLLGPFLKDAHANVV